MAGVTKKSDLKKWRSVSTRLAKEDMELINTGTTNQSIEDIFAKKKSGSAGKGRKPVKQKSRKDLRKEKRIEVKSKQNVFWMKKRGIPVEEKAKTSNKVEKKKKRKKKKKKVSSETEEEDLSTENHALEVLNAGIEEDDKLIARMEKKLGLGKKKKLPSSYEDDGLNYLLELCEPMENSGLYAMDDDAEDSEQSGDEPESKPSKNTQLAKAEKKDSRKVDDNEKDDTESRSDNADEKAGELDIDESDEESSFDEYDLLSDKDIGNDDIEMEHNEHTDDEGQDQNKQDKPGKQKHVSFEVIKDPCSNEDISAKQTSGSCVEKSCSQAAAKYVPPQLRKLGQDDSEEKRKLERLRKQLKGLINRLSEANLNSISQEIEEIYSNNSRNDTNSILTQLILGACVMPTHMPEKMLMEHMMLVAILHAHIGNEIGAFFVQELAENFTQLHGDHDKLLKSKECDNVLLLIAQLYNFKVVDSLLIYDLIRELVTSFTERDIEMLMLLLKAVGAEIRRDDPASLKDIILQIQAKAASMTDLIKQSRVRFMLEVITALRNNNLRKIPQYDPSVVEHARKVLKAVLKNKESVGDMQLRISLKDLLQAKDKGRWWVVGSAWTGRDDKDVMTSLKDSNASEHGKLLKAAKQQRMNTEIRKNIFCVIMTSEDYLDCFEKLLRLNLKDKQTREIVHVLIDCCLQEKTYNPYYAFLAQKLCEFSRGNQVTFQYSFWDRFKTITTSSVASCENMAKLLAHLLASSALSLSILKVVGFATIDKPSIRFFTKLFTILMREYPESTMKSVFSRIANLPKLSLLREGLKVFLRHFLLNKNKSEKLKSDADKIRLKELVEIAEAALDGREVSKF